MSAVEFVERSEDARILVVSQRALRPVMSRCTIFAFEDLIARFDDADICTVTKSLDRPWGRKLRLSRVPLPAARQSCLDRRYDLLFVSCETLTDLIHLGPLSRWTAAANVSVCYVEELWAPDLPRRSHEVALLEHFDHVFVSCLGAVDALSAAAGVPCHYMPPTVDAAAFCPYPDPPERVIDVYNMGRRSPRTHEALLKLAERCGLFYLFDTTVGNVPVNPAEHRRLLMSFLMRAKYFIANRAKVNLAGPSQSFQEVGSRFFEGVAGGAVIIGEAPDSPAFDQYFGWKDSVVPLPYDSGDVAEVIEELESDPERVAGIRAANIRASLLAHDWVYQWRDLLRVVGLAPRPGLGDRVAALEGLAKSVGEPASADSCV